MRHIYWAQKALHLCKWIHTSSTSITFWPSPNNSLMSKFTCPSSIPPSLLLLPLLLFFIVPLNPNNFHLFNFTTPSTPQNQTLISRKILPTQQTSAISEDFLKSHLPEFNTNPNINDSYPTTANKVSLKRPIWPYLLIWDWFQWVGGEWSLIFSCAFFFLLKFVGGGGDQGKE